MLTKEKISEWFLNLQGDICQDLQALDGKGKFHQDRWERQDGGGGLTRILNGGNIIEKGGVNYSAVFGKTPDKILKALQLQESDFYATGVSIVLHPYNPYVPIIHMNVRYFEMSDGTFWFGGGIDLTPHYVNSKDAGFFHQELKKICDNHSPAYYPRFKAWADDYFFIRHRNETRGVGGIFFDRLNEDEGKSKEELFDFVKSVGESFCPVYKMMVQNNSGKSYGEQEKNWQALRRGRYVEFNLVWDKGTKFGLDTDGRTESILMSMPPEASWVYDHSPKPETAESETLFFLKKGINWVTAKPE